MKSHQSEFLHDHLSISQSYIRSTQSHHHGHPHSNCCRPETLAGMCSRRFPREPILSHTERLRWFLQQIQVWLTLANQGVTNCIHIYYYFTRFLPPITYVGNKIDSLYVLAMNTLPFWAEPWSVLWFHTFCSSFDQLHGLQSLPIVARGIVSPTLSGSNFSLGACCGDGTLHTLRTDVDGLGKGGEKAGRVSLRDGNFWWRSCQCCFGWIGPLVALLVPRCPAEGLRSCRLRDLSF